MRRFPPRVWQLGLVILCVLFSFQIAHAAPYATVVMDARDGRVLYSRNANQRLHPASLTKMMTLYIAFSEIEAGRMSLDQPITISKRAASEPPSKIGLRAGQTIELRYLLRAAAIKSANDAATAIGEAIGGDAETFANYMSQVARGLGMKNTVFKNSNGLTEAGHYSTAYDMALLGRRLVYDFPSYYGLFSREYAETPLGNFPNSNRRFLKEYPGADGIKTGYTVAAGYNLVSSARRGNKRVIVSMFGGISSEQRNQQTSALLNLGFRQIGEDIRIANLPKVRLKGIQRSIQPSTDLELAKNGGAIRMVMTRPAARPLAFVSRPDGANVEATAIAIMDSISGAAAAPTQTVRADVSGDFAVQLGAETSVSAAERQLIAVSLAELEALGKAKNQVVKVNMNGGQYYRPRFSGISESAARRACASLQSRNEECYIIAPNYGG